MLLEINRLTKSYGGVTALNNVSLTVDNSEIIGLVGDNGAGKSTLMKCITGTENADSGTLAFNGTPLKNHSPYISRQMGVEMIYQNLNLCPQQNVTTNLFLGHEIRKSLLGFKTPFLAHSQMEKAAKTILSGLNSDIDVTQKVQFLSGGQQQAVAIARAILFSPKLVIMDEPTASLAVKEIPKVLNIIKNLKKTGITVILISHRLSDIFEVSDRIVFMRRGEIRLDTPANKTSIEDITQKIIA